MRKVFQDENLQASFREHGFVQVPMLTPEGVQEILATLPVLKPRTGTFVIHQNWPTIANVNDTTVTVWCPLQDVVETNGALQFGSSLPSWRRDRSCASRSLPRERIRLSGFW